MVQLETQMNKRIRKFRIALLSFALLGMLFCAGAAALTQTENADRTAERNARRVEKQIDELEKAQAGLRLDLEKRWAVIETQLSFLKWLTIFIGIPSATWAIKTLMDVAANHKAQAALKGKSNENT